MRQKTAPIPVVSQIEPTPAPKTIRLKRPSAIVPVAAAITSAAPEAQMAAQKSETAKIELPKAEEFQVPETQRKTIKIKRTDRNVMPRTVKMVRPPAAKPTVEAALKKETPAAVVEGVTPAPAQEEETIIVFPIAASLAAAYLFLLAYLLAAQVLGPQLALPVPSGLF